MSGDRINAPEAEVLAGIPHEVTHGQIVAALTALGVNAAHPITSVEITPTRVSVEFIGWHVDDEVRVRRAVTVELAVRP